MATNRAAGTVRSLIGERLTGIIEGAKDVPYDDLAAYARDQGLVWRLREIAMVPLPDATVIARYDVLLGFAPDALEVFDEVSIRLAQAPGPVSLAARAGLTPTLIHLVFGRLPPAPMPERPAAPPAHMNGHEEHDIDMSHGDVRLPGEDSPRLDAPELNMVDHTEPDGLPILRDPYEIGAPEATSREVIDAIKRTLEEYLPRLQSVEQLNALARRNPELIDFVHDFGDEDDSTELRAMIAARKEAIRSAPMPRRRGSAAAEAN